ncbi:MAG: OmpA family protein [Fidelibacterota bacterium]
MNHIIFCSILVFSSMITGQSIYNDMSKSKLKRVIQHSAPSEEAYIAVQKLAKPFILEGDWGSAISIFEQYRNLFPQMSRQFDKIIHLLSVEEEGWIVEVMNDRINTMQFNELSPVPSADGKFLYFASDRTDIGYGKEDVFISELNKGDWSPARNVIGFINTSSSEAPSSLSMDGVQMILFGNYEGSKGRGDLFISEYVDTIWTPVIPFPSGVNTRYYEGDGVYSPDGKAFFFTSDRPGGIGEFHKRDELFHGNYAGNLDIYVMERTEFGTWKEPENLGPKINTSFCDQDPFITPDGMTLYFSSEGHYGLGGLDIFKSQRISKDSWTRWSEPVNLGKEINSVWDDSGYKWDASGDSAFFAIAVDGKANIYTVKKQDLTLPHIDLVKVYGMITGKDSSRVRAEILASYADSDSVIISTFTDSLFGVFHLNLEDNNKYLIIAKKEGYSTVIKTLNLGDYGEGESTSLDFSMKRLPVPIPDYSVPNILFDFRSHDINSDQLAILDELVLFIEQNPKSKFEIRGFTDNVGNDEINLDLSRKRVISVLSYLTQQGISNDHFEVNYFGSLNPVQPNDTEEGRQQNRRVEIKQIKSAPQ